MEEKDNWKNLEKGKTKVDNPKKMVRKISEKTLPQLLSFPYLWSPEKIVNFLKNVHNYLKASSGSISYVKNLLNSEAKDWGVLEFQDESGNWNWSRGLSHKQLAVLTSFCTSEGDKKHKMTYKFDCVTDLVTVFRHKHEHRKELPNEAKECLFGKIPNEHLFDHAYVSFWIAKFPCLVTFLWFKLRKFVGDNWKLYYSRESIFNAESECPDLQCYLTQLEMALDKAKSEGLLQARYTVRGKTLEFYQLPTNTVHSILSSGCSSVIFHIYQDHVNFFWSDYVRRLSYRTYFSEEDFEEYCCLQGTSFAVLDDVNLDNLCSIVTHCQSSRIMYFTANVSNLVKMIGETSEYLDIDISEVPLSLHEFRKSVRKKIYKSIVRIGKVGKRTKLRSLLDYNEIDRLVRGNLINDLLRGNAIWLFSNYSLPILSPCFMRRRIVRHDVPCPRSLFPDLCKYKGELTHTELRNNVYHNRKTGQVIFIADKCGSGKSEIMKKIAREMFKYKSKFVFIFAMRKFIERLGEKCNLKSVKISDILSFVSCQLAKTDFEKSIVHTWFSGNNNNWPRIRFELFLDGLDEVSEELQETSLSLLDLSRNSCPSIRLWITSRDHMVAEIERRFQIQAQKLVPIDSDKAVDLTYEYCLIYLKRHYSVEEQTSMRVKAKDCYKLALKCTSTLDLEHSDLTTIPLHCEMLADFIVYNKNIKNEFFEDPIPVLRSKTSLLQIYEHVIQKKMGYFLEKFNLGQNVASSIVAHCRQLQMNDMIRSATLFSLQCVFGKDTGKAFESVLIPDQFVQKIFLDQGFVQSFDDLVFCHKSISEYLVVKFIFNVYTKGNYSGVCKTDSKFKTLLWNEMFRVTLVQHRNSPNVIHKYGQLCKVFTWFCKKHTKEDEECSATIDIKRTLLFLDWIAVSGHRFLCFHFLTQQKIATLDTFDSSDFLPWRAKLDIMEKECNETLTTMNLITVQESAAVFKKWVIENFMKVVENEDIYNNLYVVCVLVKIVHLIEKICENAFPGRDIADKWAEGNYVKSLDQMLSNELVELLLTKGNFQSFEDIVVYELPKVNKSENFSQPEKQNNRFETVKGSAETISIPGTGETHDHGNVECDTLSKRFSAFRDFVEYGGNEESMQMHLCKCNLDDFWARNSVTDKKIIELSKQVEKWLEHDIKLAKRQIESSLL